jgi:hypothetical protein
MKALTEERATYRATFSWQNIEPYVHQALADGYKYDAPEEWETLVTFGIADKECISSNQWMWELIGIWLECLTCKAEFELDRDSQWSPL